MRQVEEGEHGQAREEQRHLPQLHGRAAAGRRIGERLSSASAAGAPEGSLAPAGRRQRRGGAAGSVQAAEGR